LIYRGSYEGWYSTPDEQFVAAADMIEDESRYEAYLPRNTDVIQRLRAAEGGVDVDVDAIEIVARRSAKRPAMCWSG
jgi:hypothetical protein